MAAAETPSRFAVPGRKLSTTTSAVASSRSNAGRAAGSFKSSATLFFPAIEQQMVDAAAVHERRQQPHRIAAARIFDLDHFGAQLGEHQRGKGAGKQTREIEDAHAGEWKGHVK